MMTVESLFRSFYMSGLLKHFLPEGFFSEVLSDQLHFNTKYHNEYNC